ncbi:MAG: hypothetical protein ACK4GK_01020 [Ferrovibrio sp.]
MKKLFMNASLVALCGILSGCVTSKEPGSSVVAMVAPSSKYDGAFSKGEMTVRSGPCPQLSWGSVVINNGQVSGNIAAGSWAFRVSGLVDEAGTFHQLQASGSAATVSMTGKFTDPKTAAGDWSSFGNASCSGAWKLSKG